MNIRWAAVLLPALFLSVPAAKGADPFDGKTLDEIREMIGERMEDRKRDREFAGEFKSFFKKEEGRLVRTGIKLATGARAAGEFMQAEYLFRYGQYAKSIELLMQCEKKCRKSRRQNRWLLVSVYLQMAADYAYLNKRTDAGGYIRRAREEGIGTTLNKVQKKLLEYPARLEELNGLREKRDLAPQGGKEKGDNQWALCLHYQGRIFLPVGEYVELSWMIRSFPAHAKVKGGDASWAQVKAAEKLMDHRQAIQLIEKFRKTFSTHWAERQGETLWALALAQYGRGSLKDAKRTAERLKRLHPKARPVESRLVDNLIRECARGTAAKDRFAQGNPWNRWWDY